MKYDVEKPGRLIDITRLPLDRIEDHEERPADRRARHQRQGRLRRPRRGALPAAAQRHPGRRLGAAAQRRHHGRQPAPADPLLLLLRHGDALQQARARLRLPAIGGINRIHAIFGASEHCIATHPSDMCVALAALEATVQVSGPQGDRSIPFADFHRLPGDAPEHGHQPRPRRDHRRGGPAGEPLPAALHLPEAPRPPVLRLRAGLGGGGPGVRRRHG